MFATAFLGVLLGAPFVEQALGQGDTGAPDDAGTDAAAPAEADGASSDEPPSAPTRLFVGVYPLRIADVDLHAGAATLTYYVWTRWEGERDGTAYEVMNGTLEEREHEYREDEGDVHYAYYRCRATVDFETDFRSFPIDEHDVYLELEHSDDAIEWLVMAVDDEALRDVPAPAVSGWNVEPPTYAVREVDYHTNWGVPGADPDEVNRFSRFRMTIRLHHELAATFAKTFIALFISVLIAFLGFFMHPEELEARVGIAVAGIFGAVTSYAVVAGNLPDIPYLTLSDKIHFAGMAFVFVALVESCLAGYLCRQDRLARAERLDRWARVAIGPGYALVVVLLLWLR